ncbi:MAG TPA: YtxH domain-containing protein [Vicinamibacteria bacterium]|nr:YtxH domain-containing protein [Vicinamibacteria bacterium]
MSDDRGTGASGIILSFLMGGLTGAALAILFAPRSGRETRELLSERLKEGAERGRDLRDRATQKGREVLEEASDYVERTREGLDKRKDRLATAIEAGRQAYREEKEKM